MTIKTKFNVSDIVYFIWVNKVCSAIITGINIQVTYLGTVKIKYTVRNSEFSSSLCEDSLFATKEELIKSL